MIGIGRKYLGADTAAKLELMEYYNQNIFQLVKPERRYRIQPNDNWCAMFVSVVAHKAGFKVGYFPFEVSVYFMTKHARELGLFTDRLGAVKAGDLIIYDWNNNGVLNHVGIIESVSNGVIRVLEGNYRGAVGVRSISVESREIYGYIRLIAPVTEMDDNRLNDLVRRTIVGEFGNGVDRMEWLKDDYQEVQKRVNKILKG